MGWDAVIDQHHAVATLRRAVAAGRVAHAYLFHGPDGAGKRAVALALAQTLQCEQGTDAACGACPACRKVARLIHPDVHLLLPQPKDAADADVAARRERLAANPYAAVDFVRRPVLDDPSKTSNKQAIYAVGRVSEELRPAMSYKPLEGRYKVVILTDAERMRTEAANAFLKLLEEPGPQTVFVLTTSRPDQLLPTIVSRCQRLRFDALPAEAVEQALVAREGLGAARAATLARMADGSYTRALDLAANDDLMEDRGLVVEFLRLAYMQQAGRLADVVEQVARLGRERVKGVLRLMLSWIRDLMLYRALGESAPLVNVDQAEAVARFCANLGAADLDAMARLVEEAAELTERNVHVPLLLTALSYALRRAMDGPHSGRLYVPLVEADAFATG